ncbi:MAG TPA: DUF4350 domain-containing protein [Gemmatimonadaceae bacterium]
MRIIPRDRRTAAIVAGLAVMLLFAILFAPGEESADPSPRLTTHSRSPWGARGFLETAERLGWRTVRNEQVDLPPPRTDHVYAVLAPPIQLTAAETHRILERVRAGAGLFAVLERRTPLADSLGVRLRGRIGRVPEDTGARCAPSRRSRAAQALRGAVFSASLEANPPGGEQVRNFIELTAAPGPGTAVAAAGFALGRGRVGVVADPDILTNAVLRTCRLEAGARLIALLGYVATGDSAARTRSTIVFDEYHHGYGTHPSVTRVTTRFVASHPVGRTLGHLSLAGVVLLAAAAARPAPPAPARARSRRSPLEHVNALALAYSRIQATRTVARLLVRGLRRRLRYTASAGPLRTQSDDEFLQHLAKRFPAVTQDLERVRGALRSPVGRNELVAVGRSIATIERTVTGDQR